MICEPGEGYLTMTSLIPLKQNLMLIPLYQMISKATELPHPTMILLKVKANYHKAI